MDEKFDRLLSESLRLFKIYGIRSISMDDIARELGMSKKTLSLDLRERVVAVVLGGMSRGQAAARFAVSAASAVRWCRRQEEAGSPASYKRGGDRWSGRIDAHQQLILSLVDETCDITLKELQAQLA